MTHWNAGKVIGGIEQPRFLVLGNEISPNISFEEDLNGVTGVPGTRVFDASTPFGDYALKIVDDSTSTQEFVDIAIDAGEPVANKRFIIFAHVKNILDDQLAIWTDFPGLPGTNYRDAVVDRQWRRKIVHEILVPATTSGNIINFRIYPTGRSIGSTATGTILIDNFHTYKVNAEYLLPLPDRGQQAEIFREIKQAEHELIVGSTKTYRKGFRYLYEGNYEKLDKIYESQIAKMRYSKDDILFFPHKDAYHCYLVKWADEMERAWSFGTAALGHKSSLSLISTELLEDIPEEVFDTTIYIYPENVQFIEHHQSFIVVF